MHGRVRRWLGIKAAPKSSDGRKLAPPTHDCKQYNTLSDWVSYVGDSLADRLRLYRLFHKDSQEDTNYDAYRNSWNGALLNGRRMPRSPHLARKRGVDMINMHSLDTDDTWLVNMKNNDNENYTIE